ncbi:hypothetical protein EVAR_13473_1 [Eumeta japonica]|uniref:Uncharacterized protein n=1 Tax=Eumeta variegata TaxID=151549 RepID=A0A4C1UZX9_EUMVA|nr:hypothetical protein EVAR_13473_1 [Eumeta japonica]
MEVWSGPPELSLTERNKTAEAAISLLYLMRVCYVTSERERRRTPARRARGAALNAISAASASNVGQAGALHWSDFRGASLACELPESRWSPPSMDTRNSRKVTSALPASWVGTGYLMEVEWDDV